MTRPIVDAREKLLAALAKHGRLHSQREIAVLAGIVAEPVQRNGAKLRLAQRAVSRLVNQGLIRRSISPEKVDNSYVLSPSGRAVLATLHSDAIRPTKDRTEQQEVPR